MDRILWINKKLFLWAILCALFSIAVLSPLGSPWGMNPDLPNNDYIEHGALIVQAKTAIDEGQFPIRTTALDHQGLGYPMYQFYGPFAFTVAGYVYKAFAHVASVKHVGGFILTNPFNTIKWILWLVVTLGGIYAYRLARLITESDVIAMLAATTYIFAPYFILTINFLGDYPEVFAQGCMPMALFYTMKNMLSERFNLTDFLFSAVAWFILLTSHLVTFAYCSLFFVLLSCAFCITKLCTLKGFFCSLLSIAFAYLLAAWFIVPILQLSSHIQISSWWLSEGAHGLKTTTLGNMFALNATGASHGIPFFYASIGWMFLFGFVSCVYFLVYPKISKNSPRYKLTLVMSVLFLLAIVMAWSPVNFWKFLPHNLAFGQYGHRFLSQIMWLGIFPFILAIENIFGVNLDAKYFVVGIFMICLTSASWIQPREDGVSASTMLQRPELLYGGGGAFDYILKTQGLPAFSEANGLPLSKTKPFCKRQTADVRCKLNITQQNTILQIPALYYPNLLMVLVDGKAVSYEGTTYNIFNGSDSIYTHGWVPLPVVTINLPSGEHEVVVKFIGIHWANRIAIFSWVCFFLLALYALCLSVKRIRAEKCHRCNT